MRLHFPRLSKNIAPYLIACSLLWSCHKGDKLGTVVYDSPYYLSGNKEAGKLRVFTRAGEVLSPGTISYYSNVETNNLNGYLDMILVGHQGIDTIQFTTNQEASTVEAYSRKTYRFVNGRNRLELSSKDTLTGFSYFAQYSKTLPFYISQLKPEVFQEYLYSSTPQYTFGFKSIEKLIVIPQNDQVELPLLTYAWYNNRPTTTGHYFYNTYNSLDPEFYKNIVAGDTVIVKETTIVYSR